MAQSLTVGSGLQQHSQAITPVTTASLQQRSGRFRQQKDWNAVTKQSSPAITNASANRTYQPTNGPQPSFDGKNLG